MRRRTAKDELYGRYHGRILVLAARSTEDGVWKSKLREILAEFDDDCGELAAADDRQIRYELASQIERNVLRFSDPTKRAVLAIALKHFDGG
jgi:hypothetical protein